MTGLSIRDTKSDSIRLKPIFAEAQLQCDDNSVQLNLGLSTSAGSEGVLRCSNSALSHIITDRDDWRDLKKFGRHN